MCTSLSLQTKEGGVLWGRTLDFDRPFGYYCYDEGAHLGFDAYMALELPRGSVLPFDSGEITLAYQIMGLAVDSDVFGQKSFTLFDGINEHGILGGAFYFFNYANYGEESAIREQGKRPLVSREYLTWALGNCQSLDEIIQRTAAEVGIIDGENGTGVEGQFPLHFVFVDPSGRTIVLEPTDGDGTLRVFENPLGVLTNSPTFDWHMTNLENYTGLVPHMRYIKEMAGGVVVETDGAGSGLIGMPGDYTSQSRFVRAATLVTHSRQPLTQSEGQTTLFQLLSSFNVTSGVLNLGDPTKDYHTQYTVGYDLNQRSLFVTTYENRRLETLTMSASLKEAKRYQFNYSQDTTELAPFVK